MNKKIKSVAILALVSFALFFSILGFNMLREGEINNDLVIAVVNEDDGGLFNANEAHFGSALISGLVNEHKYTWKETSRQVADLGIESGEFAIAIYIPANFTERAIGLDKRSPDKALVDFKINIDDAYFDTHGTGEFIGEFEQYTNTALSEMYYELVFVSLSSAKTQVSNITDGQNELNTVFAKEVLPFAETNHSNIGAMIDAGQRNYEDNRSILAEAKTLDQPFSIMQKQYDEMDQQISEFAASYDAHSENAEKLSSDKLTLNEMTLNSNNNIISLKQGIQDVHRILEREVDKVYQECTAVPNGNGEIIQTCKERNYTDDYRKSIAKALNVDLSGLSASQANQKIRGAYTANINASNSQIKYFLGDNYNDGDSVATVLEQLRQSKSNLTDYKALVENTTLYNDLRELSQDAIGINFDSIYTESLNDVLREYLSVIPSARIRLASHSDTYLNNLETIRTYKHALNIDYTDTDAFFAYEGLLAVPEDGLQTGKYDVGLLYGTQGESESFAGSILEYSNEDYKITKVPTEEGMYEIELFRDFTAAELISIEFKLQFTNGVEIKSYDYDKILVNISKEVPEEEEPFATITTPFSVLNGTNRFASEGGLSHLTVDTYIQVLGTMIPKIESGLYENQKSVVDSKMIETIDKLVDEISLKVFITIIDSYETNMVSAESNVRLNKTATTEFENMIKELDALENAIDNLKGAQKSLKTFFEEPSNPNESIPTFVTIESNIELYTDQNSNVDEQLAEIQNVINKNKETANQNAVRSHDLLTSVDDFPQLLSDFETRINVLSTSFETTQKVSNDSKNSSETYLSGVGKYNNSSSTFMSDSEIYKAEIETIFAESLVNGKVNEDLLGFLTQPIEVRDQTVSQKTGSESNVSYYPFVVLVIISVVSALIGNIFAMNDRKKKQGVNILIPVLTSLFISLIVSFISGQQIGMDIGQQLLWSVEISLTSLLITSITHVIGYYTNTFGLIVSFFMIVTYILLNGNILESIEANSFVSIVKSISILSWIEPALRSIVIGTEYNHVPIVLLLLIISSALYIATIVHKKVKYKDEVSLEEHA